jgi:hypothetical protein
METEAAAADDDDDVVSAFDEPLGPDKSLSASSIDRDVPTTAETLGTSPADDRGD